MEQQRFLIQDGTNDQANAALKICMSRGHHRIPIKDCGLFVAVIGCKCGSVPDDNFTVNKSDLRISKDEILPYKEVPPDECDQYFDQTDKTYKPISQRV